MHEHLLVEQDTESGARVYLIGGDARHADSRGNIWVAESAAPRPALVCPCKRWFGHVSVSRCGRYWIGDTGEDGIPIYIGKFGVDTCQRVVFSRTVYDGKQWSHAHPYLTADNQWLIFTSTRGGHPQVYAARLRQDWLDGL